MCGFYDIAFIEYVLSGKTLLDYTNLFPPNGYIYDKIVYKYFKDKYVNQVLGLDYKKIDDVKIFVLNEINHNDLMSKKSHYLNNVEHLFFSVLTVLAVFQFLHLLH